MDMTQIDNKLLGGQGGDGIMIDQIAFKFDTDITTKEETALIEIMGTAYVAFKDPYNPNAGYDELSEPFPVKDNIKVAVAEGKKSDNEIIFNTLNRQLNLSPPLVDNNDAWERFTQDGEDSVYDKIVGQKLFYRAKKGSGRTGEKLSDYFFNLTPIATRLEAKKEVVKDKISELLAKKRKKQEERDAAMSAFTA